MPIFSKTNYRYIALVIVFFSWANITFAGFEIAEIMYDTSGADTNREWIEVQNTGPTSEDLSKWFFFSDDTKHAISAQTSPQVPAGGYAIIAQNPAKFITDWPSFNGLLFDSSWTGLNNKGETIALKDPSGNIASPVTFNSGQGGGGDGESLQKINNIWRSSKPTPGAENKITAPVVKKDMTAPKVVASTKTTDTVATATPVMEAREPSSKIIDLDTMGVDTAHADTQISNKTLAYAGLGIVIVIGSSSIFLLRRRNSTSNGDKQTISVDDMTIVD